MSCDVEYVSYTVCYTDAAGSSRELEAVLEIGSNDAGAVLVATRYVDAAGNAVETSGGTVTKGSCPMAPASQVTQKTLCDVVDPQDPTQTVEFCRTTLVSFNIDGSVDTRTVTDYELDGTTVYTVIGEVEDCKNECPPSEALGILSTWGV